MARMRYIKPGFFLNDQLAEIEPLGRLLFAGLWTIADRDGKLEDRPKRIKAEILPYDNCDIDKLLNDLEKYNFIQRYIFADENYILITNFARHQTPHIKETASIIPDPHNLTNEILQDTSNTETAQYKHGASTVQALTQNDTSTPLTETETETETATEPARQGADDAFLSQSDGAAIAALKNAGVDPVQSAALVTAHGAPRCLEEVEKARYAVTIGKVNDLPAWICASLNTATGYTVKGWKSPKQRAAEREASAAEKQRQIEIEQEKARRAAAEHERQKALDALFASKPPDEQRRIAAEIVASYQQQGQFQRDMIKRLKSGGKSDLQAIKASPILQSVRNEYLSTAEQAAQC